MKSQIEAQNLERKSEAEAVAKKVDGKSVILVRQAGETGQLYGSVSTRDIADALTKDGYSVERRQIVLNAPIKVIGLHVLPVALHPEVEVKITVNVARTPDEAERQAKGEDLTVARSDADEARAEAKVEAEKFFEQTPEELKEQPAEAAEGEEKPAKG
jgi:large subunit ribosomal protein L9